MAVETRLVEVELSWYDPQAQARHNCQADLTLPAVATAQLSDFPTNDEVRQAVALLMSARARQDAVKLVDRGDIEGARHLLRQVKNEMLAHDLPLATTDALGLAALEQDLAEQRLSHYRKMSHYQAYSRGHTAGLGYDDPHRYGGGPQLGDITQESVEAIVNSVGVDFASQGPLSQAIFKAAGPELAHEVARIGRLGLGEACLTPGYNLPARWIIHTAPAGWQGGQGSEAAILAQCYASCISLAEQYGLATIAFPALGAGLLGFPPELAAEIALKTTSRLLRQSRVIGQVKFVCFDPETLRVYQEVFRNYFGMD
jgi:Ca-activated chloride channel family protein